MRKNFFKKHELRNIFIFLFSCGILFAGIMLIWVSTFQIPTLETIEARKISQSTKIYDSTDKILLFDVYQNTQRTVVPFDEISKYIKDATLSIEDKDFYTHHGIKPLSILRAIIVNTTSLSYSQGGSTITQQVVKNSILTGDKTPTRKLKELVLALKLEQMLSKDRIFDMYLNEISYGGSLYGVEEASQAFFGKKSSDVTIAEAEAAYLASLPQAPSYYSPYGTHKDKLDERKNVVLREMLRDGKISDVEYQNALTEKVNFLPKSDKGIKAPHFVMFVKDYLENKYGIDVIEQGGLKVTTTLNYDLQTKAEAIAKQYAEINEKSFNGTNDAFVAIDPKTGAILTMVGSRDYFDTKIDGNFNVTTAHRQPGSAFKPFVYAEAFIKGYTPDTVLFDLPTQFSVKCPLDNFTTTLDGVCYAPVNYDDKFRGPLTLREALAQSINVPSVKTLYLAGIKETIDLATSMGIKSLGDANIYGLTLVLGGGEVSLLDMASAYGVFATEGMETPYTSILKVEDKNGKVLEEIKPELNRVLDAEVARKISDILSDNVARTPLYGADSVIYFGDREVAVKTGTTNNYKDAWILGYTPSVVVGTWAGNNDNTPMAKKVSGLIVAPMWRVFMDEVLKTVPVETFIKPMKEDSYDLKPVLRGKWQGGISNITQNTTIDPNIPYNTLQEVLSGGVHSILYWVNKDDPRGIEPVIPYLDPQFERWEYSIRLWALSQGLQ
ncbi:MAG: transglycosylase domain-containing protein [Candidatus Zambryskibacteria bacterium]|nr:transglycosylase domain-containing protein [Candidatus Zambryskibacteria bacterium]